MKQQFRHNGESRYDEGVLRNFRSGTYLPAVFANVHPLTMTPLLSIPYVIDALEHRPPDGNGIRVLSHVNAAQRRVKGGRHVFLCSSPACAFRSRNYCAYRGKIRSSPYINSTRSSLHSSQTGGNHQ